MTCVNTNSCVFIEPALLYLIILIKCNLDNANYELNMRKIDLEDGGSRRELLKQNMSNALETGREMMTQNISIDRYLTTFKDDINEKYNLDWLVKKKESETSIEQLSTTADILLCILSNTLILMNTADHKTIDELDINYSYQKIYSLYFQIKDLLLFDHFLNLIDDVNVSFFEKIGVNLYNKLINCASFSEMSSEYSAELDTLYVGDIFRRTCGVMASNHWNIISSQSKKSMERSSDAAWTIAMVNIFNSILNIDTSETKVTIPKQQISFDLVFPTAFNAYARYKLTSAITSASKIISKIGHEKMRNCEGLLKNSFSSATALAISSLALQSTALKSTFIAQNGFLRLCIIEMGEEYVATSIITMDAVLHNGPTMDPIPSTESVGLDSEGPLSHSLVVRLESNISTLSYGYREADLLICKAWLVCMHFKHPFHRTDETMKQWDEIWTRYTTRTNPSVDFIDQWMSSVKVTIQENSSPRHKKQQTEVTIQLDLRVGDKYWDQLSEYHQSRCVSAMRRFRHTVGNQYQSSQLNLQHIIEQQPSSHSSHSTSTSPSNAAFKGITPIKLIPSTSSLSNLSDRNIMKPHIDTVNHWLTTSNDTPLATTPPNRRPRSSPHSTIKHYELKSSSLSNVDDPGTTLFEELQAVFSNNLLYTNITELDPSVVQESTSIQSSNPRNYLMTDADNDKSFAILMALVLQHCQSRFTIPSTLLDMQQFFSKSSEKIDATGLLQDKIQFSSCSIEYFENSEALNTMQHMGLTDVVKSCLKNLKHRQVALHHAPISGGYEPYFDYENVKDDHEKFRNHRPGQRNAWNNHYKSKLDGVVWWSECPIRSRSLQSTMGHPQDLIDACCQQLHKIIEMETKAWPFINRDDVDTGSDGIHEEDVMNELQSLIIPQYLLPMDAVHEGSRLIARQRQHSPIIRINELNLTASLGIVIKRIVTEGSVLSGWRVDRPRAGSSMELPAAWEDGTAKMGMDGDDPMDLSEDVDGFYPTWQCDEEDEVVWLWENRGDRLVKPSNRMKVMMFNGKDDNHHEGVATQDIQLYTAESTENSLKSPSSAYGWWIRWLYWILQPPFILIQMVFPFLRSTFRYRLHQSIGVIHQLKPNLEAGYWAVLLVQPVSPSDQAILSEAQTMDHHDFSKAAVKRTDKMNICRTFLLIPCHPSHSDSFPDCVLEVFRDIKSGLIASNLTVLMDYQVTYPSSTADPSNGRFERKVNRCPSNVVCPPPTAPVHHNRTLTETDSIGLETAMKLMDEMESSKQTVESHSSSFIPGMEVPGPQGHLSMPPVTNQSISVSKAMDSESNPVHHDRNLVVPPVSLLVTKPEVIDSKPKPVVLPVSQEDSLVKAIDSSPELHDRSLTIVPREGPLVTKLSAIHLPDYDGLVSVEVHLNTESEPTALDSMELPLSETDVHHDGVTDGSDDTSTTIVSSIDGLVDPTPGKIHRKHIRNRTRTRQRDGEAMDNIHSLQPSETLKHRDDHKNGSTLVDFRWMVIIIFVIILMASKLSSYDYNSTRIMVIDQRNTSINASTHNDTFKALAGNAFVNLEPNEKAIHSPIPSTCTPSSTAIFNINFQMTEKACNDSSCQKRYSVFPLQPRRKGILRLPAFHLLFQRCVEKFVNGFRTAQRKVMKLLIRQ